MEKKPPQPERRMSSEELEPFFDAHEVAASCKVSEKSLHKWAREGRIPAVKFGRLWRFRKSAINDFLGKKAAS